MPEDDVPVDSIVTLLRELVAIPSRGDAGSARDDHEPVLACIEAWLNGQGVPHQRLLAADATAAVGIVAQVEGLAPAPRECRRWYVLNATLDTAGFGDPQSWMRPPLDAAIVDGWLTGRGAGDSKAGAAIFAHLLASFAARRDRFAGTLTALFDVDEHSGRFGGARAFFDRDTPVLPVNGHSQAPRPDGVFIGYPGIDRVMVGARGFLRARLTVRGIAAHSGGSSSRGLSALLRGAALAQTLAALPLVPVKTAPIDSAFDKPAQLTLTSLAAGTGGFTQVPDRCELALDIRLTPSFDADEARRTVQHAVATHDTAYPPDLATTIDWLPGWPAYRIADTHPLLAALDAAARNELHAALPHAVAGPSNIGNYLASLGVPALCGFGIRAEGIHGADERIGLAGIRTVYRIYEDALHTLLQGTPRAHP